MPLLIHIPDGWLRESCSMHLAHTPIGTHTHRVWAGEQLQSELAGLVLLEVAMPRRWERVVQLQLGPRQSDPATHAVWLEVMGRWDPRPCLVARSIRPVERVGAACQLPASGGLGGILELVEAAEGCALGKGSPAAFQAGPAGGCLHGGE